MRSNNFRLAVVIPMLVNLVAPALAPLPTAAAPAPASLGALPSWFASASAATSEPEAALPAWFAAVGAESSPAVAHPASRVLYSAHHTIYPSAVTVSGPAEINDCDVVTFTIVAANDAVTTTNVVITSSMPTGFTPNQRVFGPYTLAPNETITRAASFRATCDAVSGQNEVIITQDDGPDVGPIYTDFAVAPGAITLRKVPSVIPAAVGDVVAWTVIVENTGYGRVDNVAVTDTLGAGLEFVSGDTSAFAASLDPGQFLTFTVSARVTQCTGLYNDVEATWGCPGQTCQNHTAQASVDLQLDAPYLDYALPDFDVDYCEGSGTFTIPVTNSGLGTAHDVVLETDMAPFSVTTLSAGATYTPGLGFSLPDVSGGSDYHLVCELAAVSPCSLSPSGGDFEFKLRFDDDCGNPYLLPVKQASWSLSGGVPSLDISKEMPGEIYLGEVVTPTITVEAANVGYSPVVVTDTLPPAWTVVDPRGGNVFTITGQVYITWTVSGDATTIITPVIRSPAVSVTETGGCDYCGYQAPNVVEVRATDCQTCTHYAIDDTAGTYIQCEDILSSHDKQVSPAAAETCAGFTYTSTYVFASSFTVTPTWAGLVFTDDLPYQAYTPGSASIQFSNGPASCGAVFSETISDGKLVLDNISPTCPITVPGATMVIVFQSTITAPGGCDDMTFYDWSHLDLGVTGNGICADDGLLEEGVFASVDAPQMSLGLAGIPPNVEPCAEYPITLTLTRLGDAPAGDVALRFDTVDYAVVELLGFGGLTPYFTHTDALSYTWFYSDDFTTATTAQVYLRVQRHCDAIGGALATAWYEGNCEDDDEYFEECFVNTGANPPELEPSLVVAKYPELYYADDDVVTWTLTLINSGPATAHEVILTDTLGADLRYYNSTITTTRGSVAGVIPDVSPDERLITWTLHEVASGAQVTIKLVAEVGGCDDLTNEFSGWQSCLGRTCLHAGPKISYALLPGTVLINTNNALSPLYTCLTRTITATVKNAGLMSVYSATVVETLPPGMLYVTGTTRYVVGAGATPPPTGWVSGGEPANGPLGPLMWSSGQITNLARLYPGETVWIRFDVRADCDFSGGNISIQADYDDVCGDPQSSSASHFAMTADPPEVTTSKVGRNLTTGSGWGDVTVAEPGDTVQWRITVQNSGGSDAPGTVVTDTLPSNTSLSSAVPAPTFQSGDLVVWDIGALAAADSRVFTVTATVDAGECAEVDTTNIVTATWGCPEPACRRTTTARAELRTRPIFPPTGLDLEPNDIHLCQEIFDLTITLNNEGSPAHGVTFSATLPTGMVYSETLSISTPADVYPSSGDNPAIWQWSTISLPAGLTTITVRARNSVLTTTGNCLPWSGPVVLGIAYDDVCAGTGPYTTSRAISMTLLNPNLVVTVSPATQGARANDVVTWTITVQNTGDGDAFDVVITDVVGSGLSGWGATAGSDADETNSPIIVGNVITWTPSVTIAVGDSWMAIVTATVSQGGAQRNDVEAASYCAIGCQDATASGTAYVTVLEQFGKWPDVQTGTIGSLIVFTSSTFLADTDALYDGLTLTDTLPAGLGYVSAWLSATYDIDGNQGGAGDIIFATPTITPGWLNSGAIVWHLGALSGSVRVNGVITAVIQNDPANREGVRLTNDLQMAYSDDGQPYVYTDTADVDVLEPLLHIGKDYVTPGGCGATLLHDNFNVPDTTTPPFGGWTRVSDDAEIRDGTLYLHNSGDVENSTVLSYFSLSFMARRNVGSTGDFWVIFRTVGDYDDDSYRLTWTDDNLRLWEYNDTSGDGNISPLVSFPNDDHWHHFEIRAEGYHIQVYADGVLMIDVIDDSHASGYTQIRTLNGSDYDVDDILITRFGQTGCLVGAGDHVTYTLTISNQARIPGYDLLITDSIPAEMSFYTYTLTSDDPASAPLSWPVLGQTGDLIWHINQLTAALPFAPLNHTALTLTVVLTVSGSFTDNIVLPNQASLAYDNWDGSSQPVGIDRDYSGGSHSTAVRIVMDYGDLPEGPYPTTLAQDGARHVILGVNNPTLGASVDAETDGQPNGTATGDDLALTPDDEDGVRLDSALIAGEVATLTITGTNVSGAYLNAWIDFDGDGLLEQIFTNTVLSAGANALTFTVPPVVLGSTLNGRFRFSSESDLTPTGPAQDGEIEDHQFEPSPLDMGDAPDTPYPTYLANDGARHVILDVNNPTLGASVDAELDGQPSVNADGDDNNGVPDDEDGVTFDSPLVPGEVATITVSASADASGFLNGWLDFEGDGGWNEALDQIAADLPILDGGSVVITFTVPHTAAQGVATYARFRFSSESDLTPTGLAPDGEVEDYVVGVEELDYGDAPDSYSTRFADDGARHVITGTNPTLGGVVDDELDGAPSPGADGDDSAGSDDEDGVIFGGDLIPGEVAVITVTAAPTADGILNGWIDFGGDGDWEEALDQVVTNLTITAGSSVVITFTVPLTASQGVTTYARFRFSTQPDLTPIGLAPDGEVEDYVVHTLRLDYGDAPEPAYPTYRASDGARHIILDVDNPTLGASVDAETDGQSTGAADGDDTAGVPDDEDGVRLDSALIAGEVATLTITGTNVSGAYLNGWIDFDGDGVYEQVFTNTVLSAGANALTFTVPLVVLSDTLNGRFRFSSESDLTPTGPAQDGEIEDHQFELAPLDMGDAPDTPYPTYLASDGARHVILDANNPTLGASVDAELDGQPSVNADGDDNNGVPDDEDGVTFDSPLVPGEVTTITVSASADASGLLNGWLDFEGDGGWNEALDQIATNVTINAGGSVVITFTVPYTAAQGDTYARFRFSSESGLTPTGLAWDGEIEDYLVRIHELDYGDAPNLDYSTVYTSDGARHIILPANNPTLGSIVDAEIDGAPSFWASGDDTTDTDDEDGVTFDSDLVPGEVATITVSTAPGAAGILNAWMDFNIDGSWDEALDQIVANLTIPANTSVVITFTVPSTATQAATYARFRFSSESDLTPTGLAPDGEVEDYVVGVEELDYGDAPDSYSTRFADDGARHVITGTNPTLGGVVDDELDGAPSPGADGDDSAGSDDEDGVIFGGDLIPGEVAVITVTAAPTATGILNGWIDFGGDGDWNEALDQVVTNLTITAGSSVVITFTVPLTASQGVTTYARFRFSTQPDLTPIGLAPDGEVEDYVVHTLRLDWGDAPEPTYPTYHASDGARHIILDVDNPTLGASVDAETDGQPTGAADGDDTTGVPDDEDGVRLDSALIAGEAATLTITGTNVSGAYLNGWIDFDGDGVYEQVFTNTVLSAGANALTFTVPLVVLSDTLNGRFRFSSESDLTPTGPAQDGEIEDHQFELAPLDMGDLPEGAFLYPTTLSRDGARHVILDANNPTLGASVDAELDGQPSVNADGDDNNGVPDDEDGVVFSGPTLVPGEVITITVTATADATGLLNAWLDFDGNGSLTDSGEQIATNVTVNAGGSVQLVVPVPVTATQGITTYARFRFSTQSALSPTGLAPDGEIEDYAIPIRELEYGDLPDGPYPTYRASDGARHILDGVTCLGSLIDAEDDGQPSTDADGDDADLDGDDEDGVTFLTPLMYGQPAHIRVEAGSAGYLNGWIDFDGDGLLDTVNVTAIDGLPVVSTMNDVFLTTGVHTFTIAVPDVAIGSSVYSRFRFTSYDTNGALSYTGLAADGEVEDYVLMSLGNLVWHDNGAGSGVRNDGALNGAESGIPGVELELYRYDDLATPIASTTSDASGYYNFTGLNPYTYVVRIPASEFRSGGPLYGLLSSTGWGIPDSDLDQDVDENGVDNPTPVIGGVSSLSVTLTLGGEPTSEDGDANSNLTVDFGFYGGRIGDYVWLELVRDGEQGTLFESPIPGVVVDLYDSTSGAYLTSDTTDGSGLYLFDDLPLNVTYTVQLSQVNFAPGGPLYPYTPTLYLGGGAFVITDSNATPDDFFGGFGYAVTTTLTSVVSEDLTLDFGFYGAPDLELVKTVAPGAAARNMPFTYSICIQNTGQVTFTAMRLTDTLPSTDFHYIGSSGVPADANTVAEPLLVWNDLVPVAGVLPPGGSLTVSFAVTATPGITGTYWNTAAVRVETTLGDVLTDTDNVPVDIRDPAVVINKEILGIDRDGVAPDYITFTIAITNVGPSVIDRLPMVDQYDPYYLSFDDATPYPDSVNDSAGRLVWNDLTASLGNLAPGDALHVTTVFNIAHEINVTTTNFVTITDVVDDYDNPANDDDDDEDVPGVEGDDAVPTPIEVVYFRAAGEEASVRLEWATAAELDLEGFHVYRAPSSSFDDAQPIGYVSATGPGSDYDYVDRGVTVGQLYWYWLAEEVSAGAPDTYGPLSGGVGIDSLPYRFYLPSIQKELGEQSAAPASHWADWFLGRWASLWAGLLPESRRM